jgi:hypothetical protein
MSQKTFSEDMVKSEIYDRQINSIRHYYGIVRKEVPLEE